MRNGLNILSVLLFSFSVRIFAQTTVPAVPVWRGSLAGAALCPPACMDGMVVVVCEGGFVRAFSYEGRDLWTYRIRGKFAPFVTRGPDGMTWVAREEVGGPKNLIALNRAGRKVSELLFDEPFTVPPEAGLDGRIFVAFGDTVVTYSFWGQKLGESKRGEAAYNGFAPIRSPLYPHVSLSMTRAEGHRPGNEWVLDIVGAAALPAYNGQGLVFVGGQNWILAAYRVEDVPLSPPSPPETYGLAKRADIPAWVSAQGIAAALDRGNVGGNEQAFASFLMETGEVRLTPKVRADRIDERVEALTLLGRLGSPEYVPFLADVLRRDPHPRIKAAAAQAIGSIGIDRDGKAMEALMDKALPVFLLRDSFFINAVVDAAGKLCLANGPPAYDRGLAILGAFSVQQNFPGIQKRAAYWLKQIIG